MFQLLLTPAHTISVYDKGSDCLLLDDSDITPMYHVRFSIRTLPQMVVSRAIDPDKVMGSAIFHFKGKSSSLVERLYDRAVIPRQCL